MSPVSTMPAVLGVAMIPPCCLWGCPADEPPFRSIPSSRALPPIFKIWV